jgi:hypothetical protein
MSRFVEFVLHVGHVATGTTSRLGFFYVSTEILWLVLSKEPFGASRWNKTNAIVPRYT